MFVNGTTVKENGRDTRNGNVDLIGNVDEPFYGTCEMDWQNI